MAGKLGIAAKILCTKSGTHLSHSFKMDDRFAIKGFKLVF